MHTPFHRRTLWSLILILTLLAAALPGAQPARAQDEPPAEPPAQQPLDETPAAPTPEGETPAPTPEGEASPEPPAEQPTQTPEPTEEILPLPEDELLNLAQDFAEEGEITAESIKDRYIVVLKDTYKGSAHSQSVRRDAEARGAKVRFVYQGSLNGFSAYLPPAALRALQNNPKVDYIEPVQLIYLVEDEIGTAGAQDVTNIWNLDRIDQRDLPRDYTYNYDYTGSGVNVYVVDSGIRTTHNEFSGRVVENRNFHTDGRTDDCNGHGTHVAGIIGGLTYGVAKNVTLRSMRVFSCDNKTSSDILNYALVYIYNNAQLPAVVNLSLAAETIIQSVEDNIINLVNDTGVFVAVAAGNFGADACNYTPSRVPEAFTVGNSTSSDSRYSTSNYGLCLDLFAPGTYIDSAGHTSDSAIVEKSGTSMSAPHAAGVAALYLQAHPSASPAQVADVLIDHSTKDLVTDPGSGSPNRLLYTYFAVNNLIDVLVDPEPSLHNQPATISVAVSSLVEGPIPTGTVEIFGTGFNCGLKVLDIEGKAVCESVIWNTAGNKLINVKYSGDEIYDNSEIIQNHQVNWNTVIHPTLRSSATYDGWVLESSRTSSKGGSLNRTSSTLRVGDDKYNRQYRTILHFNTASLPDNAEITSVQLKVRRYKYVGTSPFKTHGSLYVDMRRGAFSGSSTLQTKDWQASSTKSAAGKISSTSSSYWHTANLPGSYINKTGVSQFRLRFSKQDNGDKGSDYVLFYSGNASTSYRPQLIITYYIP